MALALLWMLKQAAAMISGQRFLVTLLFVGVGTGIGALIGSIFRNRTVIYEASASSWSNELISALRGGYQEL